MYTFLFLPLGHMYACCGLVVEKYLKGRTHRIQETFIQAPRTLHRVSMPDAVYTVLKE
jgi:hypothetical protein